MEPDSLKWVGSSCGLHGPYVFYKAFRFHRDGRPRILSLGDFFLVRCQPEDPICIAELQLLWEERTTKQLLSSSKLYFLPEDTPNGRTVCHGEDEVVAVSEKVIVRLQDLVNWTVGDFSGWAQGKQPLCPPKVPVLREQNANGQVAPPTRRCRDPAPSCGLNFRDVQREKAQIGEDDDEDGRMKVLVLSYLQYCRYRCVLARLRGRPEEGTLSERVVRALGGLVLVTAATQVLYCRDTFQHPTLGHNQSVCEHFAPNLKGRPRKKKLSISQRKDSHNQDPTPTPTPTSTLTPTPTPTPIPTPTPALNPKQPPQPSSQNSSPEPKAHVKVKVNCKAVVPKPKNGAISKRGSTEEREKEKEGTKGECGEEEQAFLVGLYKYMKERKTPIERIPYLGFKQINLWTMFQAAQKRGGYEVITARRQWKHVYDELGGNPGSTSAATCTRRHYERLLLPYERCSKGQDERPLPGSRPRKQEAEGGPEGPRVRAMAPKRPRAAHSQEPPASRGKDPHSPASNESKDNRSSQQPSLQKQKRGDKKIEEEEELQLAVKKENHTDKSPVSQTNGHDNSSINETCRDKQTPQESPKLDLIEKLDRDQPKGAVPKGTLPPSHPPWQCSKPCHSSPLPWCALDPSPAREPQIHEGVVGLMASTLKQHPPRQDGVVSGLHVNAVEPSSGGEECETLLHPPLPAKVYPLVMSPLAKKKLLSQASERGEVTSDYTFNPPAPPPPSAMMSRSSMCGASEAEDPPARMKPSSDSSSPETLLLARPSVIQHAQRAKPHWGSDEQRETHQGEPPRSETLLQNGAPLQCPFQAKTWSERSSCLDSYPHRTALQDCVLEAGVKWSPSPLQEHAYKSDLYSPLVHNLYAHTAHRLTNNHHVTKCLARDPYPLGGQSVREGLTCTAKAPDGGRMGYTPSLQSEQRRESPPRDARLAEEPTDLSLPKIPPSKPVLCGPPRNMLHWDAIVPAVSADGRPTACRVSPMPITPQRLPEDSAQHGGGWGGGVVLGYKETESVRQYRDHDVKASLQTAPQALKRPLEEQEDRASSERKIRAVSPVPLSRDCASSRAAIARVTDPELEVVKPAEPAYAIHLNSYSSEGHKYRLPSPLLGGLYPATATGMFGAQEVCDRGLGLGLTPAHPLAFLKGQTAVAPLMASPFTLHTLMMQRQLLSSQPHLYRPASNAAGPYRDLLPPGLYPPLSPLNPQPAYMSTQMPSVQPGTKL